jgi:hypothetical protein
MTIAMADVPREDAGLASGIVNVSQQVAGALGLAVLATIATSHTKSLLHAGASTDRALIGGYHLAFLFGAGAVVVALLLVVGLLTRHVPRLASAQVPSPQPARAASTSYPASPEANVEIPA